MTVAFDKLKAMLNEKGSLSDAEIAQVESESGALTDDERLWLSVELHDRKKRAGDEITVEQYVQATQVLETAAPGSPEYVEAERIITAFEAAA
jgi:hypothetical protein